MHDAYIRLVDVQKAQNWDSRGHFFSAAAEAMRRILVEHAREKQSAKRGGDWQRFDLTGLAAAAASQPDRLLDLNEAMDSLSADDEQAVSIAKMRLFVGMTLDEISKALGLSLAAVHRHWTYARARLKRAMGNDDGNAR